MQSLFNILETRFSVKRAVLSLSLVLFFFCSMCGEIFAANSDEPNWEESHNWQPSEPNPVPADHSSSQVFDPTKSIKRATVSSQKIAAESVEIEAEAKTQVQVVESIEVTKVDASIESPVIAPVTIEPQETLPKIDVAPSVYQAQPPTKPVASRRVRKPSPTEEVVEFPKENLFAEQFFMSPEQRLKEGAGEIGGFVVTESAGPGGKPVYAIVTDFGDNVVRSRKLPFEDMKAFKDWLDANVETGNFEGVEVRKVTFNNELYGPKTYYYVGHKSYESEEKAFSEIAMIKTAVNVNNGNFQEMVDTAEKYAFVDKGKYVEVLGERNQMILARPGDFIPQENLVLKMFDGLSIGDKYFGPFQGSPNGTPFVWQSFGESTWRNTNLSNLDFNEQVGFWTNRLVIKGIRAPLNTIDFFVEATGAMESDGIDFKDNLKLFAGAEWRPFAYNPFFVNYRPWSIPILEWVRNYRFYVQYGDRKPLKDEIEGSADHDLIWGVQIFYEWGIDLSPASESVPETIPDYLREYIWGEYFGNYRHEATNFGPEDDYDGVLLESSMILGFRLPGIPLPENPINNELVLMPYMRFTHVNSTEFSFPFQNQYYVSTGVRWMPFRTYKYKESEWLSKFKIFGEYVGVGKVQHAKQDGEAPFAIREDWRAGFNFSVRRY